MDETKFHMGLPMELLQGIFDILARDPNSFTTLKAFSCASSRFCSIAQPYLLRKVILHPNRPSSTKSQPNNGHNLPVYNPAEHFLEILKSSPHIASYIHGLTLPPVSVTPNSSGSRTHWLDTDAALSQLLPLLVNLDRLLIPIHAPQTSTSSNHGLKLWTTISVDSREALAMTLTTDRLLEVDLTGIDSFPVSLLEPLSSLKRLSVANVRITESKPDPMAWVWTYRDRLATDDTITSERPRIQARALEYLHIEEIGRSNQLSIFSSTSWPFDMTRLHKLSFSPRDLDSIFELPRNLAFLENLLIHTHRLVVDTSYDQLGYIINRYEPYTFMPLPYFRSLQSLTVQAKFTVLTFHNGILIDHFTSPLSWLIDFLESSFNPLTWTARKLTLRLSFPPLFPHELFRHFDGDWRRLARCLMSETFMHLETLELQMVDLSDQGLVSLQGSDNFQELAAREGFVLSTDH